MSASSRPVDLAFDRAASLLRVRWADDHSSEFALDWLRVNCPCATCREERRARAESGGLLLQSGPPPSSQVVGADLVGSYAVRIEWSDGHSTGIYPFAALRAACPCPDCNPQGAPRLLPDD